MFYQNVIMITFHFFMCIAIAIMLLRASYPGKVRRHLVQVSLIVIPSSALRVCISLLFNLLCLQCGHLPKTSLAPGVPRERMSRFSFTCLIISDINGDSRTISWKFLLSAKYNIASDSGTFFSMARTSILSLVSSKFKTGLPFANSKSINFSISTLDGIYSVCEAKKSSRNRICSRLSILPIFDLWI